MSASDEEIEKLKAKIKHELEPFINKILRMSDEDLLEFREEYKKFDEKCKDSLLLIMSFSLESDVKTLRTSIKEQIFLLYEYLGMVESVGDIIVNFLVMLLVANGKDFHINAPRIKHVYSLDDLEKTYVPLGHKLEFLRYYGIKTIPSIIDSNLRNDIAHFNFKIEKDKVTIRGKEVWEVVYPNLIKMNGAVEAVAFEVFRTLEEELGW